MFHLISAFSSRPSLIPIAKQRPKIGRFFGVCFRDEHQAGVPPLLIWCDRLSSSAKLQSLRQRWCLQEDKESLGLLIKSRRKYLGLFQSMRYTLPSQKQYSVPLIPFD